jgi:hypothetical protein
LSGFTSTLVDELDDPGAGGACALGLDSSAFGMSAEGAVADDELELLDLSAGAAGDWLWALDELSDCWAIAAEPMPRIMNEPRTTATSDFFMVHLPEGALGATRMPVTHGVQA